MEDGKVGKGGQMYMVKETITFDDDHSVVYTEI